MAQKEKELELKKIEFDKEKEEFKQKRGNDNSAETKTEATSPIDYNQMRYRSNTSVTTGVKAGSFALPEANMLSMSGFSSSRAYC